MEVSSGLMEKEKPYEDIILAKLGDKCAFERLIGAHEFSLYVVARGMLSDKSDIEDAFQETVLKAYNGLEHLRKVEFFKTWIIRIMINECRNILRKNRKVIYIEDSSFIEPVFHEDNNRLEILEIVNSLERDLRLVTILYYYEDIPQKEIADLLGIPQGTVRSRLSRAKDRLRQMLAAE
ncbi:MAG: sigma-70 family RNA polymerase sigma factor [Bacillota bacterium]|nr:sigma-70 family RNA polymerase sigma factor [Bacillota bacterium]